MNATFPTVRPGEWVGVYVTYDRAHLVVSTDHGYGPVERKRVPETRPARVDPGASLLLGGANFDGVLDDFVFAAVHASQPVLMPRDVALAGELRTLHFANGRPRRDLPPDVGIHRADVPGSLDHPAHRPQRDGAEHRLRQRFGPRRGAERRRRPETPQGGVGGGARVVRLFVSVRSAPPLPRPNRRAWGATPGPKR